MNASVTVAMLLADARLPSGGHAHSAGMEPAIAGGLSVADVPAFLLGRARTTTLVEAGTAVVTLKRVVTSSETHRQSDNPSEPGVVDSSTGHRIDNPLGQIERAWAARTPSPAMRAASRVLGRGYLRLAARIWPESAALQIARARRDPPPRAVVLGLIAAAAGLAAEDLVRLTIYDEAQSAAAALLKLEPRDPADTIAWVLATCAAVDHLVPLLAELTTPDAIPAAGAPEAEGWAEAHALLNQRLFRA
ncbi:urease accessory protein [Microbacteriaceae bacterium VKM Ac-2854]|nr:urease accessory protein [Microbacteriaceae bacterium VKM Ac-2854]